MYLCDTSFVCLVHSLLSLHSYHLEFIKNFTLHVRICYNFIRNNFFTLMEWF